MNPLARLIRKQSDAAGADVRSAVERHLWLFVMELNRLQQRRERKPKNITEAIQLLKVKSK